MIMEPRVFLGYAREEDEACRVIQNELADIAYVIPWPLVFKGGDYTLERLLLEVKKFDFGVFLIAPNDIAEVRGKRYLIARDNVILEAGIFFSELGRSRTLLVGPSANPAAAFDFHLPTDLDGLTLIKYRPYVDRKDIPVRLGSACNQIRDIIKDLEELPDERLREYLNVLSSGLIYLLRHLSLRSLSIGYAIQVVKHFNGEDTGCEHAWERAGRHAVRALTAMALATSDSHGCDISSLGRSLLEENIIKERFSRAFGMPLMRIP
jgi:hypothetical protein